MILDVSEVSMDDILTDHLGYSKICASGKLKEEVLSYHHSGGKVQRLRHKEDCV